MYVYIIEEVKQQSVRSTNENIYIFSNGDRDVMSRGSSRGRDRVSRFD